MVLYYLYTIMQKFLLQVSRGIACAPAPNGGRDGARGAILFLNMSFLPSILRKPPNLQTG
jgi:hypothetical protein